MTLEIGVSLDDSTSPVLFVKKSSLDWVGVGNGIVQASFKQNEEYQVPLFRKPQTKGENSYTSFEIANACRSAGFSFEQFLKVQAYLPLNDK